MIELALHGVVLMAESAQGAQTMQGGRAQELTLETMQARLGPHLAQLAPPPEPESELKQVESYVLRRRLCYRPIL